MYEVGIFIPVSTLTCNDFCNFYTDPSFSHLNAQFI